jgi:TM2 domain-containing membrane protein YozV
MDNSSSGGTCFGGLILLIGIIFVIWLISKRNKETGARIEPNVQYSNILQGLSTDKQTLFVMQYNNVKKDPTIALLLCLFLGGIGAHKFYLGQPGTGLLYLLFSWTFIPVIISIFELFIITGYVNQYNLQKATETATMLGSRI